MANPQKKERELSRELHAIYADEAGEMPDFSKFEGRDRSPITRVLVRSLIALVLVSAAAWAGFFFWKMNWFGNPKIVTASIEGPASVKSGDAVVYTVRYENPGSVPVSGLEISLNLPTEFQLSSSVPPASDGTTWKIGTLTPGSDGSIELKGAFRAAVPSQKTLQAELHYRPANFNSDFQDFKSMVVDISESVLSVAVSGPEKTLSGDDVTYVIGVTDNGTVATDHVQVAADLPHDFHLKASEPATASPDVVAWNVDSIAPGATSTITLHGSYTATAQGDQLFTAKAAFAEQGGTLLAQTDGSTHTDVIGGALDFHLIVNGGTDDLVTDLGSPLRVSIPYTNTGTDALGNVSFQLTLTPKAGTKLPINWDQAIGAGTDVRSGNALTWDAKARPEFAQLGPKATGTIDLTLPLLASIDPKTLSDLFTMTLTASVKTVGSVTSAHTIAATPIKVSLNSDFSAAAEARYFAPGGDAEGTGPLPPTVGQTTTYRIHWTVSDTLHPLTGVRMSSNLPPSVGWIDQKQVANGTLDFDPTTRVVTWNVGDVPAGGPPLTAWFNVAIDPDASDVGSFFKLTNATSAEATDTSTTGHLSKAIDQITTELPTDPLAKGKGIVAKQ